MRPKQNHSSHSRRVDTQLYKQDPFPMRADAYTWDACNRCHEPIPDGVRAGEWLMEHKSGQCKGKPAFSTEVLSG